MDISIIILNYQQSGLSKQCIKGILSSHISLSYEVIFVDNNSHDNSIKDVQQNFPDVIAIASLENNGYAAGNNLGIRRSQGKYILILNPDIVIKLNTVEKMHDFMEKNPRVGILGPRLKNADGTIQYSSRRYPEIFTPLYRRTFLGELPFAKKQIASYLMMDFDHQSNRPVDWLFGACLMIRKSFLDVVGLFDERFFVYFEDLDLCRRFWEKKFEVWYFADTELIHYHRRSSAESYGFFSFLSRTWRMHIFSGVKYFLKYAGKNRQLSH